MWQELKQDYEDSVQFIDVDAGNVENRDLFIKYLVRFTPTIIFVDSEGTTLQETVGYQEYDYMENLIKENYGQISLDESDLGS